MGVVTLDRDVGAPTIPHHTSLELRLLLMLRPVNVHSSLGTSSCVRFVCVLPELQRRPTDTVWVRYRRIVLMSC